MIDITKLVFIVLSSTTKGPISVINSATKLKLIIAWANHINTVLFLTHGIKWKIKLGKIITTCGNPSIAMANGSPCK